MKNCNLTPFWLTLCLRLIFDKVQADTPVVEKRFIGPDATGYDVSTAHTAGFHLSNIGGPIVITKVGMWDAGGDGFANSHDFAIWSDSAEPPVLRVTIPQGTGGELIDGYRYISIPPLTLSDIPAKDYAIGIYFTANDPDNIAPRGYYFPGQVYPYWSGPGTYIMRGNDLAYPKFKIGTPCEGCASIDDFQPNFRYDAVPEPTIISLTLISLPIAAWFLRKRDN